VVRLQPHFPFRWLHSSHTPGRLPLRSSLRPRRYTLTIRGCYPRPLSHDYREMPAVRYAVLVCLLCDLDDVQSHCESVSSHSCRGWHRCCHCCHCYSPSRLEYQSQTTTLLQKSLQKTIALSSHLSISKIEVSTKSKNESTVINPQPTRRHFPPIETTTTAGAPGFGLLSSAHHAFTSSGCAV